MSLKYWARYHGDVSTIRDGGDLAVCLGNIKARGLIMPSKTDLYFPVCSVFKAPLTIPTHVFTRIYVNFNMKPEDSKQEVEYMDGKSRLVVIDSVWGHMGRESSRYPGTSHSLVPIYICFGLFLFSWRRVEC